MHLQGHPNFAAFHSTLGQRLRLAHQLHTFLSTIVRKGRKQAGRTSEAVRKLLPSTPDFVSNCASQICLEALFPSRNKGREASITYLWRHPKRAALDPRFGQRLRLADLLRHPEIRQRHPPPVVHQNVGALYVPTCPKMVQSETMRLRLRFNRRSNKRPKTNLGLGVIGHSGACLCLEQCRHRKSC
jgi:hypothetical protein